MSNSGKLVISVILVVAVSLAGFGIWYNRAKTLKTLRFYGTDGVAQILDAEQVDVLRLGQDADPAEADAETIRIPDSDRTVVVRQRLDGKEARGLLHVRQALLVDGSYDWQADLSGCVPNWDYALRFGEPPDRLTILISLNCSLLLVVESGKSVSCEPISKGLKKYLDEQFVEGE